MSTRYIIPLLVAGAVVLACGSRAHADAPVAAPLASLAPAPQSAAPTLAPAPATHRTRLIEGAATKLASGFHVSHDRSAFHFAFDVTNPGKKSLELRFPTGQEYEFSVVDGNGKEVVRWSASKMFTQSSQNHLLDGGDTMHIEEDTPAKLPRGNYVAIATLRSSNFPVQERIAFAMR